MSFLLWQRAGDTRIASPRIVLRAAEVPLLRDAQQLRDRLEQLHGEQQQRVEEAARQARADGYAEGVEEGRREARDELAAALLSLQQAAALQHERLRDEIGALALQVVRKLLGTFADDAVLVALADTAATGLLPAQQPTLVVHPDLCAAVRERLAALPATPSAGDAPALRCEVRGDPSCARDGCRLETEHGSVDASLETQLARLAAAWTGAKVPA